jgi:glycosyltransferase involved in cell wall biosynthesis
MNDQEPIKVLHIITGLGTGGAEMMLFKLLKTVDQRLFPSCVISLTEMGRVGELISEMGIPVLTLGMNPKGINPSTVSRLAKIIQEEDSPIIQTWMYHADLIGGWVAWRAGKKHIAWNIRNSTLDWKRSKLTTLMTVGLCALLSRFIPEKIAVCSQAAAEVHRNAGYLPSKFRVIPNGFDVSTFKPDRKAGMIFRATLDIPECAKVVGLAARFDDQKDHKTFIQSAGMVLVQQPDTYFLMCGESIIMDNPYLSTWIDATGKPDHFRLLGRHNNMPVFHNACDVAVSSSAYGESFSNVLGEAMACGIPCVSTRVGGAEEVLGAEGKIVPPQDPRALSTAIIEIIKLSDEKSLKLGKSLRNRVLNEFEIKRIAGMYMDFWREVVNLHD